MGTPNARLDAAIRSAGWSNKEFARRVNQRARGQGVNVAVDAARVGRWINHGELPRDPVPEFIVALLREATGQPLTLADLGMTRMGTDPLAPSWSPGSVLGSLHQYIGSDLVIDRRDLVRLAAGAAVLAAAERLWGAVPAVAEPVSGKVGLDEVRGLETLVRHFREADAAHGGALYRKAVVAQLDTVIGLISDGQAPAVRNRLYGVAIDLAQLAGWMSHDSGLYGTAQRYFGHGIALAREIDAKGQAAEVMSRMSHQLIFLGHYQDAAGLLEYAENRPAQGAGCRRLQAMLTAQRGRALAAVGEQRHALGLLDRAGDLLAAADESREEVPEWIAYFNRAELCGARAVSRRDLTELHHIDAGPASAEFAAAINARPAGFERVRAMDTVGMAAALLDEDEPEQAAAIAEDALVLAERLDSGLIRARVRTLVDAAGRHADHPAVEDLRERVHAWCDPAVLAA